MSKPVYAGGCACGALRYRVSGAASSRCYCHCESCRKASRATFVAWATFPTQAFGLTGTTLRLRRSSAHVNRGFCSNCGTSLTYAHAERPAEFDLAVATVDNPELLSPEYHIWVSNKLSWTVIGDALPQYLRWKSES